MDIKILFIYSVELILLYLFKQTTKSAFSLKKKEKKKEEEERKCNIVYIGNILSQNNGEKCNLVVLGWAAIHY